jgi:hypothetical protein
MDQHLIRYLALIAAANARVAGMQAENKLNEFYQVRPAYGEDHFNAIANELEALSTEIVNYRG